MLRCAGGHVAEVLCLPGWLVDQPHCGEGEGVDLSINFWFVSHLVFLIFLSKVFQKCSASLSVASGEIKREVVSKKTVQREKESTIPWVGLGWAGFGCHGSSERGSKGRIPR